MNAKQPKRPRDVNSLAKAILDEATGDTAPAATTGDGKNSAAVALGKLGGAKGGQARAKKLTKARRAAIAQQGARARWGRSKQNEVDVKRQKS
jgi:hypothetical protein